MRWTCDGLDGRVLGGRATLAAMEPLPSRQCFLFPIRGAVAAGSDGREQDHQPDPPRHTSSLEGSGRAAVQHNPDSGKTVFDSHSPSISIVVQRDGLSLAGSRIHHIIHRIHRVHCIAGGDP